MAADDKVWEWDVSGIGEISFGETIIGGVQAYHFQSRLARYGAVYLLVNIGLGAEPPWKQIKKANELLKKLRLFKDKTFSHIGDQPYTRFYSCSDDGFSANDLNYAVGQSWAAGVTAGPGYQFQWITGAIPKPFTANHELFDRVNVSGPSVGLDINLSVKAGLWLRFYETEYSD